jgi:hypothetical protein
MEGYLCVWEASNLGQTPNVGALAKNKIMPICPWLMIGDFNEVMWSFEHFSKRRRPPKQMIEFREVLSFCDLHDLRFQGLPWMYDNKHMGDRNVRVRLDRVVASPSWSQWFPRAKLQHLISVSSDHCPVFLNQVTDQFQAPPKQIMRYEIMWEREESLPSEIKKTWEVCSPAQNLGDVGKSLQSVMRSLRQWSFDKFEAVTKELDNIKAEIEDLSRQDLIANQGEIDQLK